MKTIWKFPLQITDWQDVSMPANAEIISVDHQDGWLCMWAIVATYEPKVPRRIAIVGTGNPMPFMNKEKFIGTVQIPYNGTVLVWHVFESK